MIIYNVTTRCDEVISRQWLSWIRDEHIPDLIATGCFTHAVIVKLLDVDDSEGPTYAVQYHAQSKDDYNRYIREYAESMRKKSLDKWGDKIISFRTVMEVVH